MNQNGLLLIGIAAMLLMALGIVLFVVQYQRRVIRHEHELKFVNFQKQVEILRASIKSEEDERTRIAHELHDDVGATLATAQLFIHRALSSQSVREELAQSRQLIDDSLEKIRILSHKLQPSILVTLGLSSALQAHFDTINRASVLNVSFQCENSPYRQDSFIELNIYRITQEILTNILKYAQATICQVRLHINESVISLDIRHNGDGLTDETYNRFLLVKHGIGLKNINNRITIIQGTLSFQKSDDGWYGITIQSNPKPIHSKHATN